MQKLEFQRLVKNAAELAIVVRDARKSLGITQQELAGLSGVSVRSSSHLESKDSSMSFGKLMATLTTLGLSLEIRVLPI